VLGAVEYLEWVGSTFGGAYLEKYSGRYSGRRLRLKQALAAIRAYEFELSRALLETLEETPGVQIYGVQDVRRLEERVPTFSFTLKGWHPRRAAEKLAEEGIYTWDGNYYALSVTEQLGLEDTGGMIRVGPVHYNTVEEIEKFREALGRITTIGSS
jgi:selenocysteine lyase/cysteine desulfurase